MEKKNQLKRHESRHSQKRVTRVTDSIALAERWKESQKCLAIAAKLEQEEKAIALAQYKKEYKIRKKQIILKEMEDAYY